MNRFRTEGWARQIGVVACLILAVSIARSLDVHFFIRAIIITTGLMGGEYVGKYLYHSFIRKE